MKFMNPNKFKIRFRRLLNFIIFLVIIFMIFNSIILREIISIILDSIVFFFFVIGLREGKNMH